MSTTITTITEDNGEGYPKTYIPCAYDEAKAIEVANRMVATHGSGEALLRAWHYADMLVSEEAPNQLGWWWEQVAALIHQRPANAVR